jgi:uncharacterized protein YicC (UPF0701 family)
MMGQQQHESPLRPALAALGKLRGELKKRGGKEGGNLNEKLLSYVDTIDATLKQIDPLSNMLKLINQQTELAVSTLRLAAARHESETENGDDGSSDTKGQ